MPYASTVDTGLISAFINVKDAQWGAKGDGSTDDTTALQTCFNSVASGSDVYIPSGVYMVSASLLYPGNIRIRGAGDSDGGTIIRVKAGTALTTPVLCSKDWYSNASTSGNPVHIRDLQIDGNSATSGLNAHGITEMNYWSSFDNISIINVAGDGLLYSAQTRNGTHITNTVVEPKISRIQVRTCGGHGIHIQDSGTPLNSATDGFCRDCLVTGAGLKGIYSEMSPGWIFHGNHIYGTGQDALYLSKCYATRCQANYIDGFGSGSATYIAGIVMSCLDGRGSSCIANHIGFEGGSATGPYQGIAVTGAGSATTVCTVAHNTVVGGGQSGSLGYVIQTNASQQGHPWIVYFHDNDSQNVATRLYMDQYVTGGDLKILGHFGSESQNRPTAVAGANAGTTPPAPVLTNCTDMAGKISFGTGTTPAAGIMVVLTFNSAYVNFPSCVISPLDAGTQTLGLYVTRTASTMSICCSNAPAASQANTTYNVCYHVDAI